MSEDVRSLRVFNENVSSITGTIIHETILLERMIDVYLSNIFGKNKEFAIALRDWVFTERINLESKIQILKLVIERYNEPFAKEHKSYFTDLIYIMEQRNIFAHYLIVTT